MKLSELLADESKWTKEADARDADGCVVPSTADAAVCWSLTGAVRRCYGHTLVDMAAPEQRLMAAATQETDWEQVVNRTPFYRSPLVAWNDAPGRTFAAVRRLVERAGV